MCYRIARVLVKLIQFPFFPFSIVQDLYAEDEKPLGGWVRERERERERERKRVRACATAKMLNYSRGVPHTNNNNNGNTLQQTFANKI